MSKHLKNIGIVATLTMASRVLGLARDMLTTAVFGATSLASAFYTAFTLPNLFRRLLGEGALTAAFVPTLQEELKERDRAGAFALVSRVASWLLIVTTVLVVVAIVLLRQSDGLVHLGRSWGLDEAAGRRWLQASGLAVVLFPYLIFVCLAAIFSAALQTFHRFLEPALSPIWLNVAMIAMLGGSVYLGWSATPEGQVLWLCGGALIGGFLQMTVPAIALMGEGWRPKFDLSHSTAVRQIARLMGPTVFGSAIYLINMTVSRFVGVSLNDQAVTLLNLSTRLMELPIGVFAVAVSTVVFPLIAKHAADRDHDKLADAYRKGMRLILVINIPAAVGLTVLALPIIRLLFQRGRFDAHDTAMMTPVLAVFALGLPFFSFVNLVLRAFYALKDTVTPVRAALLSFVVNLGLSLLLMKPFSTVGLALASNVAIVVQAWYLQGHLARKHPGLAFGHLWRDLLKIFGATAVMGVVVYAGNVLWSGHISAGRINDAVGVTLLVVTGVAVYGGLLWWWKIDGRDDLAAIGKKMGAKFF